MGENSGSGQVQSVDRALVLLEAVAAADGDVSLTELASRVGVHKSTASRLLATLEAHRLVVQGERGRYRPGLGLLSLAASATSGLDLVRAVNPVLRELSRDTGETANLAVLAEDTALYLDQVTGRSMLQANSWVGQRVPLHATSNGKVLLAYSDPSLLRRICSHPLERFTPRTLTAHGELAAELERTRIAGTATAVDEWEQGLTAIASPVFGVRDELVASVSLSGPTVRLAGTAAFADRVRAAAAEMSRRLA